jgi:hypothetical protein
MVGSSEVSTVKTGRLYKYVGSIDEAVMTSTAKEPPWCSGRCTSWCIDSRSSPKVSVAWSGHRH